jgi:hypothetical protein
MDPHLPLDLLCAHVFPRAHDGSGPEILNLLLVHPDVAAMARRDADVNSAEGISELNFWLPALLRARDNLLRSESVVGESISLAMASFYDLVPSHILAAAGMRGVLWSKTVFVNRHARARDCHKRLPLVRIGKRAAFPAAVWEEGTYSEGFLDSETGAYVGPTVVYSHDLAFFGGFGPEDMEAWYGEECTVRWNNGLVFTGGVGLQRPWQRSGQCTIRSSDGSVTFEGEFGADGYNHGVGLLTGPGLEPTKVTISSRGADWSRFGAKYLFELSSISDSAVRWQWGSETECDLHVLEAPRRVVIMPKDIQLARRIRGERA